MSQDELLPFLENELHMPVILSSTVKARLFFNTLIKMLCDLKSIMHKDNRKV